MRGLSTCFALQNLRIGQVFKRDVAFHTSSKAALLGYVKLSDLVLSHRVSIVARFLQSDAKTARLEL